ncbi:MAG: ABC transporter ATP-binding protein [Candidatus Aminicenantaceae bacterium]
MIKVEDLHKSFREKHVLRGVTLEARRGEILVVIGQSGSGKSVLLKQIIGLMKPDSGRIFIDGKDVSDLKEKERVEIRSQFGMLFQGAALFDSMTVEENVAFGLKRFSGYSPERIKIEVREALDKVGLGGIEKLMPHELSGGMKKRVGLARAIVYEPNIMLYDEPSTGLDPIRADAINDLILQLAKEMEVTSIVITHDMASAYKVADRIAMLYNGTIKMCGTSEEIQQSNNPAVKQFIHGLSKGPIESR